MQSDTPNLDTSTEGSVIRLASVDDVPVLLELFERSRIEGQLRDNDTGADLDHLVAGYFESVSYTHLRAHET